ncbi:MAG: signal peptidase II [Bacilli bacterium]|nr:signal peptidase II [Bacilli bacterium]
MKKITIVSIITILIDQIIKYLIITNLKFTDSINVIKNFFRITYLQNTGAAWSILSGNIILLILITLIALVFIFMILKKKKEYLKIEYLCYGLLIGGIIGNLIDRIRYGFVIDYLDFNFGEFNYPVFNLADICIVVSAIILIIISMKEDKNGNKSRRK